MCTFVSKLPKRSKTAESASGRKKNTRDPFVLYFRPTEGKNVYRFRLLNFTSSASNRDFPFIEKYVHEHWVDEKKEDGSTKGRLESFSTCSNTTYMNANGLDYECPICKYGWAHFRKWKESGKKDAISRKKWQKGMNKYVAILPIYVVKDPHNPDNNGTIRTIILKDKEMYKSILSKIKETQKSDCVFNGKNAVDFYASVHEEETIYREGEPTEFRFTRIKLDKTGFTTKPYDLPAITKELINNFPFDDEYYTMTTEEESQEFLEQYVMENDINVPADDILFEDGPEDLKKNEEIAGAIDEINKKSIEEKIEKSDDIDINELIGEINEIDEKDDSDLSVDNIDASTDDNSSKIDVDDITTSNDDNDFNLDDLDNILGDIG